MREIKFRAWMKDYKKMCKVNQIDFEKQTAWIEADNGGHETRHTTTRDIDDIEIMQYTGSKDKNGIKIYEGDIAKLQDGHTSYYVVEWHKNGMWIFRFLDNEHQYYSFNSVCDFMYTVNHEVIGNIYENPDLVEV